MLFFKSKTAKVLHMRTPIIIVNVKSHPSPQVTIKEYKHPKATTSEAYFALHFSSFEYFLSSKVFSLRILSFNTRSDYICYAIARVVEEYLFLYFKRLWFFFILLIFIIQCPIKKHKEQNVKN